MNKLNQEMVLEIEALIWDEEKQQITLLTQLRETGEIVYLESTDMTEKIYARAESLGISVGELVDQVNQEIDRRIEERNRQNPFHHQFKWTWRLGSEQLEKMIAVLLGENHD